MKKRGIQTKRREIERREKERSWNGGEESRREREAWECQGEEERKKLWRRGKVRGGAVTREREERRIRDGEEIKETDWRKKVDGGLGGRGAKEEEGQGVTKGTWKRKKKEKRKNGDRRRE